MFPRPESLKLPETVNLPLHHPSSSLSTNLKNHAPEVATITVYYERDQIRSNGLSTFTPTISSSICGLGDFQLGVHGRVEGDRNYFFFRLGS